MILLLPLTIACLSGLILNHTVDLGLSKRSVTNPMLMARYGMTLNGRLEAFGLDDKVCAAEWGDKIFYGKNIISGTSVLLGAVPLRDGTAIVTGSAVHYYGLDGELIEILNSSTLPTSAILKAGRTKDLTLVLETAAGSYTADANLLEFNESPPGQEVEWSVKIEPTEADKALWEKTFSGDGIPLDRVILDLHSGRFFGSIGKWIYDLTVIGVLILSITGFVLFIRTRRRARSQ